MIKILNNIEILDEAIKELGLKINKGKKVLVFAGSQKEFDIFCKARMQDFELKGMWEGYEYLYLDHPDCHRGMIINELLLYGTYYLRKDIDLNKIYPFIRG